MEIKLHRNFIKDYLLLPKKIKEKFKERRNLFIEDKSHPFLNNHSVDKKFPGCRSINITGDYRVIYKETSKNSIVFMRIGTHSELY